MVFVDRRLWSPFVIVTGSWNPKIATSFRAMEAGAVAVIAKPLGISHPDCHRPASQLVTRTVKSIMAEVKVVRRWTRQGRAHKEGLKSPCSGLQRRHNQIRLSPLWRFDRRANGLTNAPCRAARSAFCPRADGPACGGF